MDWTSYIPTSFRALSTRHDYVCFPLDPACSFIFPLQSVSHGFPPRLKQHCRFHEMNGQKCNAITYWTSTTERSCSSQATCRSASKHVQLPLWNSQFCFCSQQPGTGSYSQPKGWGSYLVTCSVFCLTSRLFLTSNGVSHFFYYVALHFHLGHTLISQPHDGTPQNFVLRKGVRNCTWP